MGTISKENKSVKDFIQTVLIKNIGSLVWTGNHYLGFGPQTQAIELLGAIIEDEAIEQQQPNNPNSEFYTQRKSRRRFHYALKLFSNPKYIQFCPELKTDTAYQADYDLYCNLRCGYAHQMRPIGKISVTTEPESITDGTTHLEIDPLSVRLIVVSEILYRDLKEACEKAITMIDNGQKNHTKPYGDFLGIISYA
jgi:hypothetical protein